ncbi:MAG: S46 family peptidase [Melioribacteraceae bacterium]|nr:S46 family peptidase [Melioribacteraceae bacterium]
MKKSIRKSKYVTVLAAVLVILFMGMFPSAPEEGMYPLSEVGKLDLVKAGLKIDPQELYNPNGTSLIDALVNIGGCTGSFVSEDGLVITNHHCAFGAISRASTPETNFLSDGFVAKDKSEEIPAKGYTVRIMESYKDVSEEILEAVADIEDLAERSREIGKKMRELAEEANDEENSIEARVSEMFLGQTYVLFKYRIIKDVRLVYAPPQSIGNFGGETDNWMWPRHTGDFSFMRAYVAPDGSAAEYSAENIPFKPKKFLKVNPNGVQEGDFTFILGYPGRTYRHLPSQFLEYQQDYHLPYIADLYEWIIEQLEDISADDETLQLEVASYKKGLANTSKNYRGKMLGINRIGLVDKKIAEEEAIAEFINSDDVLKEKYSTLFSDIDSVYSGIFKNAEANLWFGRITRFSTSLNISNFLLTYLEEMKKPNLERKSAYRDENVKKTIGRLNRTFSMYYPDLEERLLFRMLTEALNFEGEVKIEAVNNNFTNEDEIEDFINSVVLDTKLTDKEFILALLEKPIEEIEKFEDPMLTFASELKTQLDALDEESDMADGALSKLSPKLIEVKKAWKKTSFIPDANSTLRLTYGYIKGYSPADATYYSPITTLDGVIDKANQGGEYEIPEQLRELYESKDYGRFVDKKLGSVPVAILYNMDTTGGNSGSPILNANGELIGVNFDRAFEATINDYAWNESYSRSIGVDIRYVLWITQKIGNGGYLLKEMGVEL